MSHPACDRSGGIFHIPLIPSHFIGQSGHATHAAPMEHPCLSSEVTSPLSVGHPAPPFTPLVRPRTAVCSRGARARRERSGSGAPADRYSGAHRAAAPPCPSSALHVQPCRSRGRSTLPLVRTAPRTCSGKNSRQQPPPPDAHPSPVCRAVPRGTWRGAPPT